MIRRKKAKRKAVDKSLNAIIDCASVIPAPLKKIGRPTKYNPAMCDKIIELMSDGKSKTTACVELGIYLDACNAWEKKYKEFSAAVKRGEELCERWWVEAGRKNLWNKQFQAVLWMMNMSNRFGWNRKVEGTVKGELSTDQKHEVVKKIEEEKPVEHTAEILSILVGAGAIQSPAQQATEATTH